MESQDYDIQITSIHPPQYTYVDIAAYTTVLRDEQILTIEGHCYLSGTTQRKIIKKEVIEAIMQALKESAVIQVQKEINRLERQGYTVKPYAHTNRTKADAT